MACLYVKNRVYVEDQNVGVALAIGLASTVQFPLKISYTGDEATWYDQALVYSEQFPVPGRRSILDQIQRSLRPFLRWLRSRRAHQRILRVDFWYMVRNRSSVINKDFVLWRRKLLKAARRYQII